VKTRPVIVGVAAVAINVMTAIAAAGPQSEGAALYSRYCSVCHQPNGEGIAGVFPPLRGNGVVNKADPTTHIEVVLDGVHGRRVSGFVYAAAMSGFADTLSDGQIAKILNYERGAWGNHGRPVAPKEVAAVRAAKR